MTSLNWLFKDMVPVAIYPNSKVSQCTEPWDSSGTGYFDEGLHCEVVPVQRRKHVSTNHIRQGCLYKLNVIVLKVL